MKFIFSPIRPLGNGKAFTILHPFRLRSWVKVCLLKRSFHCRCFARKPAQIIPSEKTIKNSPCPLSKKLFKCFKLNKSFHRRLFSFRQGDSIECVVFILLHFEATVEIRTKNYSTWKLAFSLREG